MKTLKLSLATILAASTFAIAGGDIEPVMEPVVETPMVESVSGFYIGIGASDSESDFQGASIANFATVEGYAPLLLVGYQFNEYVALEGRYQWSTASLTSNDFRNGISADATNVSLFVKPQITFDNFTLYGLLGYGSTKIEFGALGGTRDTDESSFQYGIGAEYALNGSTTSLFVDYTVLYDDTAPNTILGSGGDDDLKIDALNFGLKYRF